MFNLLRLFASKKKKIDIQIKVFLKWRKKRGMSSSSYEEWLYMLSDYTGKDDVYDLKPIDILGFIDRVRVDHNGTWPVWAAEKAVRQFMKFYTARGKMMGNIREYRDLCERNNVRSLSDVKRNRELVRKRLKDPQKWSWRRLGAFYGIHFTTAKQIFLRDVSKYAQKGVGKLSTGI